MNPVIYQWSDGSVVELSPFGILRGEVFFPWLILAFPGDLSLKISLRPEREAFASSSSLTSSMTARGASREEIAEEYPKMKRKIFGLLLDLGVVPNNAGILLRGSVGDVVLPFFVSDDLWSRRYELAKAGGALDNSFEAVPDYMGIGNIYRLEIRYDRWEMNWQIKWMSGRSGGEVSARKHVSDTFENAVQVVMRENNIFPESDRSAWEEKNVERGTFLIPTPEEVEVFRILDEPLPFFLPGDEVQKWMSERQA